MEWIPESVPAESGTFEMTAQTFSGAALTCCVMLVVFSMPRA
jgi:hypothetical protein